MGKGSFYRDMIDPATGQEYNTKTTSQSQSHPLFNEAKDINGKSKLAIAQTMAKAGANPNDLNGMMTALKDYAPGESNDNFVYQEGDKYTTLSKSDALKIRQYHYNLTKVDKNGNPLSIDYTKIKSALDDPNTKNELYNQAQNSSGALPPPSGQTAVSGAMGNALKNVLPSKKKSPGQPNSQRQLAIGNDLNIYNVHSTPSTTGPVQSLAPVSNPPKPTEDTQQDNFSKLIENQYSDWKAGKDIASKEYKTWRNDLMVRGKVNGADVGLVDVVSKYITADKDGAITINGDQKTVLADYYNTTNNFLKYKYGKTSQEIKKQYGLEGDSWFGSVLKQLYLTSSGLARYITKTGNFVFGGNNTFTNQAIDRAYAVMDNVVFGEDPLKGKATEINRDLDKIMDNQKMIEGIMVRQKLLGGKFRMEPKLKEFKEVDINHPLDIYKDEMNYPGKIALGVINRFNDFASIALYGRDSYNKEASETWLNSFVNAFSGDHEQNKTLISSNIDKYRSEIAPYLDIFGGDSEGIKKAVNQGQGWGTGLGILSASIGNIMTDMKTAFPIGNKILQASNLAKVARVTERVLQDEAKMIKLINGPLKRPFTFLQRILSKPGGTKIGLEKGIFTGETGGYIPSIERAVGHPSDHILNLLVGSTISQLASNRGAISEEELYKNTESMLLMGAGSYAVGALFAKAAQNYMRATPKFLSEYFGEAATQKAMATMQGYYGLGTVMSQPIVTSAQSLIDGEWSGQKFFHDSVINTLMSLGSFKQVRPKVKRGLKDYSRSLENNTTIEMKDAIKKSLEAFKDAPDVPRIVPINVSNPTSTSPYDFFRNVVKNSGGNYNNITYKDVANASIVSLDKAMSDRSRTRKLLGLAPEVNMFEKKYQFDKNGEVLLDKYGEPIERKSIKKVLFGINESRATDVDNDTMKEYIKLLSSKYGEKFVEGKYLGNNNGSLKYGGYDKETGNFYVTKDVDRNANMMGLNTEERLLDYTIHEGTHALTEDMATNSPKEYKQLVGTIQKVKDYIHNHKGLYEHLSNKDGFSFELMGLSKPGIMSDAEAKEAVSYLLQPYHVEFKSALGNIKFKGGELATKTIYDKLGKLVGKENNNIINDVFEISKRFAEKPNIFEEVQKDISNITEAKPIETIKNDIEKDVKEEKSTQQNISTDEADFLKLSTKANQPSIDEVLSTQSEAIPGDPTLNYENKDLQTDDDIRFMTTNTFKQTFGSDKKLNEYDNLISEIRNYQDLAYEKGLGEISSDYSPEYFLSKFRSEMPGKEATPTSLIQYVRDEYAKLKKIRLLNDGELGDIILSNRENGGNFTGEFGKESLDFIINPHGEQQYDDEYQSLKINNLARMLKFDSMNDLKLQLKDRETGEIKSILAGKFKEIFPEASSDVIDRKAQRLANIYSNSREVNPIVVHIESDSEGSYISDVSNAGLVRYNGTAVDKTIGKMNYYEHFADHIAKDMPRYTDKEGSDFLVDFFNKDNPISIISEYSKSKMKKDGAMGYDIENGTKLEPEDFTPYNMALLGAKVGGIVLPKKSGISILQSSKWKETLADKNKLFKVADDIFWGNFKRWLGSDATFKYSVIEIDTPNGKQSVELGKKVQEMAHNIDLNRLYNDWRENKISDKEHYLKSEIDSVIAEETVKNGSYSRLFDTLIEGLDRYTKVHNITEDLTKDNRLAPPSIRYLPGLLSLESSANNPQTASAINVRKQKILQSVIYDTIAWGLDPSGKSREIELDDANVGLGKHSSKYLNLLFDTAEYQMRTREDLNSILLDRKLRYGEEAGPITNEELINSNFKVYDDNKINSVEVTYNHDLFSPERIGNDPNRLAFAALFRKMATDGVKYATGLRYEVETRGADGSSTAKAGKHKAAFGVNGSGEFGGENIVMSKGMTVDPIQNKPFDAIDILRQDYLKRLLNDVACINTTTSFKNHDPYSVIVKKVDANGLKLDVGVDQIGIPIWVQKQGDSKTREILENGLVPMQKDGTGLATYSPNHPLSTALEQYTISKIFDEYTHPDYMKFEVPIVGEYAIKPNSVTHEVDNIVEGSTALGLNNLPQLHYRSNFFEGEGNDGYEAYVALKYAEDRIINQNLQQAQDIISVYDVFDRSYDFINNKYRDDFVPTESEKKVFSKVINRFIDKLEHTNEDMSDLIFNAPIVALHGKKQAIDLLKSWQNSNGTEVEITADMLDILHTHFDGFLSKKSDEAVNLNNTILGNMLAESFDNAFKLRGTGGTVTALPETEGISAAYRLVKHEFDRTEKELRKSGLSENEITRRLDNLQKNHEQRIEALRQFYDPTTGLMIDGAPIIYITKSEYERLRKYSELKSKTHGYDYQIGLGSKVLITRTPVDGPSSMAAVRIGGIIDGEGGMVVNPYTFAKSMGGDYDKDGISIRIPDHAFLPEYFDKIWNHWFKMGMNTAVSKNYDKVLESMEKRVNKKFGNSFEDNIKLGTELETRSSQPQSYEFYDTAIKSVKGQDATIKLRNNIAQALSNSTFRKASDGYYCDIGADGGKYKFTMKIPLKFTDEHGIYHDDFASSLSWILQKPVDMYNHRTYDPEKAIIDSFLYSAEIKNTDGSYRKILWNGDKENLYKMPLAMKNSVRNGFKKVISDVSGNSTIQGLDKSARVDIGHIMDLPNTYKEVEIDPAKKQRYETLNTSSNWKVLKRIGKFVTEQREKGLIDDPTYVNQLSDEARNIYSSKISRPQIQKVAAYNKLHNRLNDMSSKVLLELRDSNIMDRATFNETFAKDASSTMNILNNMANSFLTERKPYNRRTFEDNGVEYDLNYHQLFKNMRFSNVDLNENNTRSTILKTGIGTMLKKIIDHFPIDKSLNLLHIWSDPNDPLTLENGKYKGTSISIGNGKIVKRQYDGTGNANFKELNRANIRDLFDNNGQLTEKWVPWDILLGKIDQVTTRSMKYGIDVKKKIVTRDGSVEDSNYKRDFGDLFIKNKTLSETMRSQSLGEMLANIAKAVYPDSPEGNVDNKLSRGKFINAMMLSKLQLGSKDIEHGIKRNAGLLTSRNSESMSDNAIKSMVKQLKDKSSLKSVDDKTLAILEQYVKDATEKPYLDPLKVVMGARAKGEEVIMPNGKRLTTELIDQIQQNDQHESIDGIHYMTVKNTAARNLFKFDKLDKMAKEGNVLAKYAKDHPEIEGMSMRQLFEHPTHSQAINDIYKYHIDKTMKKISKNKMISNTRAEQIRDMLSDLSGINFEQWDDSYQSRFGIRAGLVKTYSVYQVLKTLERIQNMPATKLASWWRNHSILKSRVNLAMYNDVTDVYQVLEGDKVSHAIPGSKQLDSDYTIFAFNKYNNGQPLPRDEKAYLTNQYDLATNYDLIDPVTHLQNVSPLVPKHSLNIFPRLQYFEDNRNQILGALNRMMSAKMIPGINDNEKTKSISSMQSLISNKGIIDSIAELEKLGRLKFSTLFDRMTIGESSVSFDDAFIANTTNATDKAEDFNIIARKIIEHIDPNLLNKQPEMYVKPIATYLQVKGMGYHIANMARANADMLYHAADLYNFKDETSLRSRGANSAIVEAMEMSNALADEMSNMSVERMFSMMRGVKQGSEGEMNSLLQEYIQDSETESILHGNLKYQNILQKITDNWSGYNVVFQNQGGKDQIRNVATIAYQEAKSFTVKYYGSGEDLANLYEARERHLVSYIKDKMQEYQEYTGSSVNHEVLDKNAKNLYHDIMRLYEISIDEGARSYNVLHKIGVQGFERPYESLTGSERNKMLREANSIIISKIKNYNAKKNLLDTYSLLDNGGFTINGEVQRTTKRGLTLESSDILAALHPETENMDIYNYGIENFIDRITSNLVHITNKVQTGYTLEYNREPDSNPYARFIALGMINRLSSGKTLPVERLDVTPFFEEGRILAQKPDIINGQKNYHYQLDASSVGLECGMPVHIYSKVGGEYTKSVGYGDNSGERELNDVTETAGIFLGIIAPKYVQTQKMFKSESSNEQRLPYALIFNPKAKEGNNVHGANLTQVALHNIVQMAKGTNASGLERYTLNKYRKQIRPVAEEFLKNIDDTMSIERLVEEIHLTSLNPETNNIDVQRAMAGKTFREGNGDRDPIYDEAFGKLANMELKENIVNRFVGWSMQNAANMLYLGGLAWSEIGAGGVIALLGAPGAGLALAGLGTARLGTRIGRWVLSNQMANAAVGKMMPSLKIANKLKVVGGILQGAYDFFGGFKQHNTKSLGIGKSFAALQHGGMTGVGQGIGDFLYEESYNNKTKSGFFSNMKQAFAESHQAKKDSDIFDYLEADISYMNRLLHKRGTMTEDIADMAENLESEINRKYKNKDIKITNVNKFVVSRGTKITESPGDYVVTVNGKTAYDNRQLIIGITDLATKVLSGDGWVQRLEVDSTMGSYYKAGRAIESIMKQRNEYLNSAFTGITPESLNPMIRNELESQYVYKSIGNYVKSPHQATRIARLMHMFSAFGKEAFLNQTVYEGERRKLYTALHKELDDYTKSVGNNISDKELQAKVNEIKRYGIEIGDWYLQKPQLSSQITQGIVGGMAYKSTSFLTKQALKGLGLSMLIDALYNMSSGFRKLGNDNLEAIFGVGSTASLMAGEILANIAGGIAYIAQTKNHYIGIGQTEVGKAYDNVKNLMDNSIKSLSEGIGSADFMRLLIRLSSLTYIDKIVDYQKRYPEKKGQYIIDHVIMDNIGVIRNIFPIIPDVVTNTYDVLDKDKKGRKEIKNSKLAKVTGLSKVMK